MYVRILQFYKNKLEIVRTAEEILVLSIVFVHLSRKIKLFDEKGLFE